MSTLLTLAHQIEHSAIGLAIAESRFAYPIIEGAHLIGLAVSVGLLFMIDVRLMGVFFKHVPVQRMLTALRPYVLWGFAVTFASGILLFWSSAERMLQSPPFAFKLLFLALAGINALAFELFIARRYLPKLDKFELPLSFRFAGCASLTLWTLTIAFGRLIPYLPTWS
jgi:hypothetical protein